MSITKVNFIGSVCWGGGLSLHAEYQLQVVPEDETASWTIYRRYSAFHALHKRFVWLLGGEEAALATGLIFPAVNFLGSRLSTSTDTINQRKAELQKYMEFVLTQEKLTSDPEFLKFLDTTGKGTSGIVLDAGAENVVKEAFVQAKVIKGFPFAFWAWCFVALLRDGTLCVLQSKYDNRSNALAVWKINSSDMRIVPKASDNSITIFSSRDEHKISIRLVSAEESAFWMRTLSDLCSSSAYQNIVDQCKDKAEQNRAAKRTSRTVAPIATGAPAQVEHIHATGTGNTADDLSSMYGI